MQIGLKFMFALIMCFIFNIKIFLGCESKQWEVALSNDICFFLSILYLIGVVNFLLKYVTIIKL